MSSRRKSRPVRRLDMICQQLKHGEENRALALVYPNDEGENPGFGEEGNMETRPEASEEAPVEDEDQDNSTEQVERRKKPSPPEGVYILQPEGVSDDEEGRTLKNQGAPPRSTEVRKRSHEGRITSPSGFEEPGLDLSVKKPRMDVDRDSYFESGTLPVTSSSLNLFSSDASVNQDLEKYQQLLKLKQEQKPLPKVLDEVGLSQKILEMHQLNNQLTSEKGRESVGENKRKATPSNIVSTMFEKFSTKSQPNETSTYDGWSNEKESHDAKIQALLREANEDVIHQQRVSELSKGGLSQLPMGLHPSMTATLMASLANSQDPNREERQDFLRKLFKAQQYYSDQTPTKSNDSFVSLTRTPPSSRNDSITAGTVSSGVGSIKKGTLDPANFDEDVFDQYIAKFTNVSRCGSLSCPYFTRDHYHCVVEDCNYQRFTNKADVIRHYNMHKKRDNSLAHGFLRFSPTEDCSSKYPNCHLNGKSTHYHCMQPDCNKVYTSTSDVMTHENFHKKYMQFVCSGFKRFRATERCDLDTCTFRDQKTTHFHCTREGCNFTFKNKCDIEKHKTYHLRDDAYISKGFKKYYKNESCNIEQCVWNFTANHFHCLRPGCNFSFTSTSQMESHRRKHERNEFLGDSSDSTRDLQTTNSPSMVSSALFQEAARKILSAMPTTSLPQNQQLSYKGISYQQQDANVGQTGSSGSISPSAPVGTIRNIAPLDLGVSPKLKTVTNDKEQIAWKAPPAFDGSSVPSFSTSLTTSQNDKSKAAVDMSRPEWQRGSGVISPSMAMSAAAALKPSNTQVDSFNGVAKQTSDVPEKADTLADANEKTVVPTKSLSSTDAVLRYFASSEAFKCWVSNCDLSSKHHFHCLVQDCGAVFATSDNVMKHANFHQVVESMGVSLPVQTVPEAKHPKEEVAPTSNPSLSPPEPPPGYIALGTKSSDLPFFEKTKPTSPSLPSSSLNEPSVAPFSGMSTTQSQIAQQIASALGWNVSAPSDPQMNQPQHSSTPSSSAYRFLQSQALLSSLGTQSPQGQHPSDPQITDGISQALLSNDKKEMGFIHIKTGMPCLRADCKYIQQNHWHCTMNRCRYVCKSLGKAQTHRQAHDSLETYAKLAKQCFRSYSVKKKCPNANCEFKLRGHYHCLKPGCQFATIGTSKLPWHMKKHEKIARREASGFKYFTKKEQCGHFECKYNGLFSHYHCIRTGCTFAFQYKHQMSTHVRKHLRRMLGRSYAGDVQDIDHTNVDSGDDSLPLIIDEVEEAEQRPGSVRGEEGQMLDQDSVVDHDQKLTQQQWQMLEEMTKQMKSSYAAAMAEQGVLGQDGNATDQDVSAMEGMEENDSNSEDNMSSDGCGALDLSSVAAGSSKSNESGGQQQNDIEYMNEDVTSNSTDDAEENLDNDVEEGHRDEQNLGFQKEVGSNNQTENEKVLNGFHQFEAGEECGGYNCPYFPNVSHYHCTRENCAYRFVGRTHLATHQQHHDRIAGLLRDDFERFKYSTPCNDEQCEYKGKNTHFHCLRCDFKCTDNTKVGTHRRQHMKADTLQQSGFERIRGKHDCGREDCKYRDKNMSHFHCLRPGCHFSVIGRTGVEVHAEKHRRGLVRVPASDAENKELILKNLEVFRNMQQHMLNASMKDALARIGSNNSPNSLNLAPIRQLSSTPQTPTSPNGVENGLSNHGSPFLMTPGESPNLLSKFAFLSSSTPGQEVNVGSPVATNSAPMVTESVGS